MQLKSSILFKQKNLNINCKKMIYVKAGKTFILMMSIGKILKMK